MALVRGRSSQEKAELLRGILLGVRVCVCARTLSRAVFFAWGEEAAAADLVSDTLNVYGATWSCPGRRPAGIRKLLSGRLGRR